MKKLKIIHILNSGDYSGAEKVAIFIIKAMCGICDSIYLSPDGYINEVLRKEDITHYSVKRVTPFSIKKAIDELRPDVIHAHDFKDSIAAAFCRTTIPVISHLHNNPPWMKRKNWKTVLYYLSSHKYRQIFTVSQAVLDEYVFRRHIQKKTKIIGNPVDLEEIRRLAEKDNYAESYDIVFVGRLTEQKNPIRFVRAVNGIKRIIPEISAVMLGDGELRGTVLEEIGKRNLGKSINLLGFVENPYPIMRKSKILCITSDWEGYGLSAVEALALGVPVVCMNVGGLPGIVDENSGKVCKSEEEMIGFIGNILSTNDLREKYRTGAMKRSEELNNSADYCEKIYSVYAALAK